MTELSTLSFEELIARLCEPADTLILFHRGPDADAVGSAFALRQVLEGLGSRAFCVCQDELPQRLRFLAHEMQESVLPEAIPEELEVTRIISVDSASPSQLGTLYPLYEGKIDLMIDHHGMGEPYADHYIRPDLAATGEIMFDLVKELATAGQLTITEPLCVDLYAAISSDTGGFRFANVTSETHMRAAELLASGLDAAAINHRLFVAKTMEQLRAQAAGISNLQVYHDGRVGIVTFPYALKVALGLQDEHLETLVDIARSLAGVQVAISIRQPNAEPVFRVSTRATEDYDVASLCAIFGGGGHKRAAGCTISAADMDEAVRKLVNAIDFSKHS